MTPEERKLVVELFDRLATLEDAQRDPDAERLIKDGMRQAPNAPYALVQTVLVQDEALKRANARLRALESGNETPPRDASFLGGMRDTLFGARESRGSVPSVRSDPDFSDGRFRHVAGLAHRNAAGIDWLGGRRRACRACRALCRGRVFSRHRSFDRGRRDWRRPSARRHPFHDGTSWRRARCV